MHTYRLVSRPWFHVAALSAVVAWAPGCTRPPSVPTKIIKTPSGGPPVLTAEERAKPGGYVALASYESVPGSLPQLTKVRPIEQWTEPETAADAIGRIGAPAVPALIQTLQNDDPNVRLKATAVLGRMGPDAKDAVPELVRLLDDPDERVRKAAARTLGRIGPAAQDAIPGLMRTVFQPAPEEPASTGDR